MRKIAVTPDLLELGYGVVYANPEIPVAAELPAGWVETASVPVEADTITFVVYDATRWESMLTGPGASEAHGWVTVACGDRSDIQLRQRRGSDR